MVVLAQAKTNTLKPDPLVPNRDLIRSYTRTRITARLSDRVVELYAANIGTREVADRTGLSKTAVLRVLKTRNVDIRPRGGARR